MTCWRSGEGSPSPVSIVLDASALLAYLLDEPGADQVAALTIGQGAAISAVNLAEVEGILLVRGLEREAVDGAIASLGVTVLSFTESQARLAASLASLRFAPRKGPPLGDRACIALAAELGVPAVTADRDWVSLSLPATVALIR